jgi:hypothetical protein
MKYHAPVPAAGASAAVGVADAAGAALAAAERVGVAFVGEVAVVVAVIEPGALTPEAVRGATDDCLVAGRLRAGPAVPVAPVDFEGVPASLAELPFDAESDELRSGAAAATP